MVIKPEWSVHFSSTIIIFTFECITQFDCKLCVAGPSLFYLKVSIFFFKKVRNCLLIYYCSFYVHVLPTFVKYPPHPFLLREQPAVDPWNLFEVRTGADEDETKNQNAIERVNCGRRQMMSGVWVWPNQVQCYHIMLFSYFSARARL